MSETVVDGRAGLRRSLGLWQLTVSGVGIVIGFLHFGQGPVLPAKRSLTANREPQPEQRTWMAMRNRGRSGIWRAPGLAGPPDGEQIGRAHV